MAGYSTGLVEYLLRHRAELQTGAGLPKRAWQLAERAHRSRVGGASWEYVTTLKCDLERGLEALDPIGRELLLAAHTPGHATARLYGQRVSARNAELRLTVGGLIDRLTRAMNEGDTTVATKTNGTKTTTEPTKAEQPESDLHDVIDQKLAGLPDGWQELHVKRGMDGQLLVRVVY